MDCYNCGAPVTRGTEYCPKCGFHVLSQRKAIYLSKIYYNKGLEKASVRDLSGAITCLKQSLKFHKQNIEARNLLGLVYFETGEVVAALSEWVISKNLRSRDNLASEYIDRLQANPGKLEVINRTVNKYNLALSYCRQGHEDMAEIQLKKLLSQNPKLIKGYHLLALIQIKNEEYSKARRTLKKAMKIDKTNTTTLRFLREVDEQTGTTTDLSGRTRRVRPEEEASPERRRFLKTGNDFIILPPVLRESSAVGFFLNLLLGVLIGAAAIWFLVVPAKTQQAYDTVNKEIQQSGGTLGMKVETLQAQLEEADKTGEAKDTELATANGRADSTQALLLAYRSVGEGDYSTAAEHLKNVQEATLSEDAKAIYQNLTERISSSQQGDISGDDGYDGDSDTGYDSDSDSGYSSDSDSAY